MLFRNLRTRWPAFWSALDWISLWPVRVRLRTAGGTSALWNPSRSGGRCRSREGSAFQECRVKLPHRNAPACRAGCPVIVRSQSTPVTGARVTRSSRLRPSAIAWWPGQSGPRRHAWISEITAPTLIGRMNGFVDKEINDMKSRKFSGVSLFLSMVIAVALAGCKPNAPSDLTKTNELPCTLSWTDSLNETGYNIYIGGSCADCSATTQWTKVASVGQNVTSYSWTKSCCAVSECSCAMVRAFNDDGESKNSNIIMLAPVC